MRKTISRLKSATVTAGLALCLGIAVCAVSAAFADGAPAAASAVPKVIAWHDSYDAALAASKTSAKPVMVFMFAAWCEYCKQFDTETFADAKVRALSTQFESFRFDGDKDTQLEEKVAGQNHFPTVMFLSDGREVLRQVGFVAVGEEVVEEALLLGRPLSASSDRKGPSSREELNTRPSSLAHAARPTGRLDRVD